MRTVIEFRIPEANAATVLSPSDGVLLGGTVRKLVMTLPDDRFALVGRAEADRRAAGRTFFTWWNVTRSYTAAELDRADVFTAEVARVFEPAGEECGTEYDETVACPVCGADARRVGPLWLPAGRVPKAVDVARTIAGEVVVSQRFAEAAVAAGLTGFDLRPVHDGKATPGAVEAWTRLLTDSRLIEGASAAGVDPDSSTYFVWLGSPGQADVVDAVAREVGVRWNPGTGRRWYELVVSRTVSVSADTVFGENPFTDPGVRPDRCPNGHVLGLNRLSELSVIEGSMPEVDLAATVEFVGARRGLLRPQPILVASARFREILETAGLKGFSVEVARLVAS